MKLNKTCCNLVNFGSCSIVHSLGMGLFLFIDRPPSVCEWVNFPMVTVATHPRTNEVEVTPSPGHDFMTNINFCASINSKREHPPGNPWSFAPNVSPGPGDLYHLNCPGVGPIIKVPSCQLMPHEGTFQLLSSYKICFKAGGKL